MAEKEEEKYEVLEKIGQGSFGIIRKVRRKTTNQILCRKEISYSRMSEKEKQQLHAELKILESLKHPSIVQYYHREHLKSSHDLHLYMEYCGNGDLGGFVRNLKTKNQLADEDFVWSIFAQLVGALYRCHYGENPPVPGDEGKVKAGKDLGVRSKQGYQVILHRDLKPENVFLGENNSVKLGDFGLSKIITSHDFASTYVGTPFYMSPEICAAERYSHHSDIWSLGCIIYELASTCVPFDARNHMELILKIKAGRIKPLPTRYSRELSDAIAWCLKVDPRNRPDSAQLLNLANIKLARTRLQQIDERRTASCAPQERDAALAKLADVQKQVQDLQIEVQRLREHNKKKEMEWHAKATLAIDQRVHEQAEANKAHLLKQFECAVDQRAEEKLSLHLASLPASHGLNGGESTHVRSRTPPPGKSASFATTATTTFDTDGSSVPDRMDDSALESDLTSLSLREGIDGSTDISPLAQRAKPMQKAIRRSLGRAKTYTICSSKDISAPSPMDVRMAEPSPMPAPMSISGLSLSPRKDRWDGGAGMRRNLFQTRQQLRPRLSGERSAPTTDTELDFADDDDELLDDDTDALFSVPESPSCPASGLSNGSGSDGDPFKAIQNLGRPKLLPRPALTRQKTMPVQMPRAQPNNIFAHVKSPEREKENRPPSSHLRNNSAVPVVTASPNRKNALHTRINKALTPSRKAPPPPLTTAAGGDACRSGPRNAHSRSPGKVQGRTLVQLQQARTAPSLDVQALGSGEIGPETLIMPGAPKLLPSPAKWDPMQDGEDMPSPFLVRGSKVIVK